MLLHKSINASISDSDFNEKLEAYTTKGNIYCKSLGLSAYNNHPRFVKFIDENNLLFRSYAKFGKYEITERNKLVIQLVNLIWNNEMFVCIWMINIGVNNLFCNYPNKDNPYD